MSIKPVAEIHDENIRWLPESKQMLSGAKLYAIGSTHRIVSVELLEEAEHLFRSYGLDEESADLQAIIEDKP